MDSCFTAPSSFPTPHTNSSVRTPSSIVQTPARQCNVPAQSSAPSTSSLSSPPAHQFLPPAPSPGAIPRTQSPSSDRPRWPLPESLQPPRGSTRPPASIPAAPASLSSSKLFAPEKFPAKLPSIDSPAQNSPCHIACLV